MRLTPELQALAWITVATALMWVPYMLARIMTRGLMGTLANPDSGQAPDPAWAERARRAHSNAVENLAVFAPIVLVAAIAGVSTSTTVLAAQVYVAARLVHYLVYAAGIPGLRTLAFVMGCGSTLTIAVALLSGGG